MGDIINAHTILVWKPQEIKYMGDYE